MIGERIKSYIHIVIHLEMRTWIRFMPANIEPFGSDATPFKMVINATPDTWFGQSF